MFYLCLVGRTKLSIVDCKNYAVLLRYCLSCIPSIRALIQGSIVNRFKGGCHEDIENYSIVHVIHCAGFGDDGLARIQIGYCYLYCKSFLPFLPANRGFYCELIGTKSHLLSHSYKCFFRVSINARISRTFIFSGSDPLTICSTKRISISRSICRS